MDYRQLDPLSSVTAKRVTRAVAIALTWACMTTAATWVVNDRGNPGPLEVLTVQPAHATPTVPDPINPAARAQAQREQQAAESHLRATAYWDATRKATTTTTTVVRAAPRPAVVARPVSGDCASWLAAAGVTDTASAIALINRESGCNPYARNRYSGACNVAQELPCGKSGCALGDGACSVHWMSEYVAARYGSWANALAFQISHGWY